MANPLQHQGLSSSSGGDRKNAGVAQETVTPAPSSRRGGETAPSWRAEIDRLSLAVAFGIAIAIFGILRPDAFLTFNNLRSILAQSAVPIIFACGLTLALVIGEYDISSMAVVGTSSAAAAVLLYDHSMPVPLAVIAALAIGAVFGLLSGIVVAHLDIPSFIGTLAVGSLALGVELGVAKTTITLSGSEYDGYRQLAIAKVGGWLPLPVVFAGLIVFAGEFVLRHTVWGRHATAIGDNHAATILAGVPTRRIRRTAFVITGVLGAFAGVLLSARSASYYPNSGTSLLLPGYASAFIGLSLGRGWRFNPLGTAIGALLLGTITTGLTMLNQRPFVAAIVQGVVLIAAVIASARRRTVK